MAESKRRYRAIKKQRIVIGDKERLVRLEIQHITPHRGTLRIEHIGRVGDDEVKGWSIPTRMKQHIVHTEMDRDTIRRSIMTGQAQRLGGDVDAIDLGTAPLFGQSDSDATAPGTTIENTTVGQCVGEVGNDLTDNLFGLGTRDKHTLMYRDAAIAKRDTPQHILDRTMPFEVLDSPMELKQIRQIDSVVTMEETLGDVPTQESLEQHPYQLTSLIGRIETLQQMETTPFDVAYLVRREMEIGSIHFLLKSAGISPQRSVSHLRISVE